MPKRNIVKRDITQEQFHELVRKAAQPVEVVDSSESDSQQSETLELRPDDGCNETDTHPDITEDTLG